jgi:hypothetical protein
MLENQEKFVGGVQTYERLTSHLQEICEQYRFIISRIGMIMHVGPVHAVHVVQVHTMIRVRALPQKAAQGLQYQACNSVP